MKKEEDGTMRTIQEEIEPTNKKKRTDKFCGRLIIWDEGAFQDDIVILATDYCHAQPDLSPQPYVSSARVPEGASSNPPSLKPIAQRFYQRYGFLPKYFFCKKSPLN